MSEPRRSRRYAVAFRIGCDLGDIAPYQPTRTVGVPVYLTESGGGAYFVALRERETPPLGVAETWSDLGESCGYRVWMGR